jgi:hypothetical protein
MLWSLTAMRNLPVLARDGRSGFVTDVYFDDARWIVRYLVVDTGHAMPQREVLIDPAAVARDWPGIDAVHLTLSRGDVEWSPDAGIDLPLALQHGIANIRAPGDPHLRSSEVVISYAIDALDGPFGHLEDLLADDRDWSIASLVLATWPGGRRVLVPPATVRDIDRPARRVRLSLRRSELRPPMHSHA